MHLFNDRYLHFYEKINHFGQDPDTRDDPPDGDETSSRRKTVSAVSTVSFSYNYQQHNMTGTDLATIDVLHSAHCCIAVHTVTKLCVKAFAIAIDLILE